jgi:hypothetical protein
MLRLITDTSFQPCCSDPLREASTSILHLIRTPSGDRKRLDELVDILLEARIQFEESLIGGGAWEVSAPKAC